MRNLLLATIIVGLFTTTQLQARMGKLSSFKQINQLREYITTVGSNSLVSGALILTLAGAPAAIADHGEAAAEQEQVAEEEKIVPADWQQQEIMPNDHEWEKQIFYLLVDNGDERFAFHFAYIGNKGDHSLFVGRRRPYGTHVLETHAEGLATSLVGYMGEIAYNVDFTEVAAFYDELDGITNLTVISIKGLDMSDYKPATLAAFPYHTEESLRAFSYLPHAHPRLLPEEANDQFMLRMLTRECKNIPDKSTAQIKSGIHTCGTRGFAIGGLMFMESSGDLVAYHSGWIDSGGGIALGMPDNLITFGEWAVAAAPSLQKLTTTTMWGALKKKKDN